MHNLNTTLFLLINGLATVNPFWDVFFLILTTSMSVALGIVVIGYLVIHHHNHERSISDVTGKYHELFLVGTTLVLTYFIVQVLKITIALPRPFLTLTEARDLLRYGANNSFPSAHAAIFAALSASTFYMHRKLSILVGILALLIGFSRVYVGVHYPLDVIAGFAIGIVISWLVRYCFKR
jgi:undecaprenyl-diphosphatase